MNEEVKNKIFSIIGARSANLLDDAMSRITDKAQLESLENRQLSDEEIPFNEDERREVKELNLITQIVQLF